MHRPQHIRRLRARGHTVAVASAIAACSLAVAGAAAPGLAYAARSAQARAGSAAAAGQSDSVSGCHLGHGIRHIVQLTFDNVHFFRDNPNVPSDLQMMPNLLNFFENNGTFLSNNHTPLIAHTGNDILTTFTGLYGDRHGMPISNTYQAYNTDGTTDFAGSFAYWTDPVFDMARTPNPGHDTNPSMVYASRPPATTVPAPSPTTITPAPWVPYTRAGCNVGEVATANQELENTAVDIPKVFGPTSPEAQQLASDSDPYKDAETADYVGLGVHCATGNALCATAQAVKYGQTSPSPTAVADLLPDEPGGYSGFQALFGHKYVAPELGSGTPNLAHNGYEVTNAAGNLVDLNGNQINGAYLSNYPGFPGFGGINASQTLAYTADMLESGVQVVNGYIADIHGNEHIAALSGPGDPCNGAPSALASGTACYVAQAQYYNQAFGEFFQRLAADGITPANTLFVVSSDEGDHEAGANVGRALQPSPPNCDGAKVSGDTVTPDVLCTYPPGTFGELGGNMTGLLATQTGNTTPFTMEADTAPEFYVTGKPGPNDPVVRTLEHNVASLTAFNPYTGSNQPVTNFLADPREEAILHMVNADPARTPTFAMFGKPDYYFQPGPASCGSSCISQTTSYAWDHGAYAAEINTNFVGFAGPGVRRLGLDGPAADAGPNSAGPDSGQITVSQQHLPGPWVDETDIRPTVVHLSGLRDDYVPDGRVISQILTHRNRALAARGVTALGECYKQLNSSVGYFAAATLTASTAGIESSSPNDTTYRKTDRMLRRLEMVRDRLARVIKSDLESAEFGRVRIHGVAGLTTACGAVIGAARHVAKHGWFASARLMRVVKAAIRRG